MLNKLDTRWDLIQADPLRPVFQLCDSNHPLDFYIGKDINHQRLFLLITPEEPPIMRDMRSIKIQTYARDDGKFSLLLTLDTPSLNPMFAMLCEDLIDSSRRIEFTTNSTLNFVLQRLSNWRKLFEQGLPNLLNEMQIRGLCGELLLLRRLFIQLGKLEAVKAWVGPLDANQDFQAPSAAWEVKVRRPGATIVKISSEFQLQSDPIFLHLVVFELADSMANAPSAFTLNTLVDDVRSMLSADHDATELFEEKLIAAGYVPRSEYSTPSLIEQSFAIFSVTTGFPRITSELVDFGISHVSYDLLLAACEPFRIDANLP